MSEGNLDILNCYLIRGLAGSQGSRIKVSESFQNASEGAGKQAQGILEEVRAIKKDRNIKPHSNKYSTFADCDKT